MDSLCLKAGLHGLKSPITVGNGGLDVRTNPSQVTASSVGRSTTAAVNGISVEKPKISPWGFSFRHPLRSLWPGGGGGAGGKRFDAIATVDDAVVVEEEGENVELRQNGNWVLKILHVRSLRREKEKEKEKEKGGIEELGEEENEVVVVVNDQICDCSGGGNEDSDVCRTDDHDHDGDGDGDGDRIEFDRDSFSKLLRRVSLEDARLYAQMSYLGRLAYSIPQIKPKNLLKYRGLRFVTSSLEKKELATKAEKEKVSAAEGQESEVTSKDEDEGEEKKNTGNRISAYAAYQIAASAAAYLHSQTRSIIPFKSSKSDSSEDFSEGSSGFNENGDIMNNNMASFMATTDSVTAVVAAKEEVKQAVADDLNSTLSSPCGWFICDDDQSGTRYFVIQGSESMASWQANLLFEPIKFEGLDVIVHRGIYEAAKGFYKQMLPEVHAHLKSRGDNATFRFTGHSLGGSLSLLVNLMLLIRGEVPRSSLLPIITFGAPSIMCGGNRLLMELGLPHSHVQSIAMHRDIVPRAFSCNYPNHVAKLLKAVNRNFRSHPCLNNQKLLYAPMGEFLILQPDEKLSPNHDLLPSGSGLYLLKCPESDSTEAEKQLRAAQSVFLNSPHPLEILSDRSAYGADGTILRDHDMSSYLKSIWSVIRDDLKRIRKIKREHRRKVWWPLVAPRGVNTGIIVGRPLGSGNNVGQEQFKFSGILQTGRESLKRFSRLVASQHMHLLVIFLFPARLLLLGTFSIFNFH